MAAEVKKINGKGAERQEAPRVLLPFRLDQTWCSEQKTQSLFIVAQPGHQPDDITNPALWQGLIKQLQRFSTGWVFDSEARWAVEFMVVSNLPGRCAVIELRRIDIPEQDLSGRRTLPDGIRVRQGDVAIGWLVERRNREGTYEEMARGSNHPEWSDEEAVIRWVLEHNSVRSPVSPQRYGS